MVESAYFAYVGRKKFLIGLSPIFSVVGDDRLRGLGSAQGQSSVFSIDFDGHCHSTVWACDVRYFISIVGTWHMWRTTTLYIGYNANCSRVNNRKHFFFRARLMKVRRESRTRKPPTLIYTESLDSIFLVTRESGKWLWKLAGLGVAVACGWDITLALMSARFVKNRLLAWSLVAFWSFTVKCTDCTSTLHHFTSSFKFNSNLCGSVVQYLAHLEWLARHRHIP